MSDGLCRTHILQSSQFNISRQPYSGWIQEVSLQSDWDHYLFDAAQYSWVEQLIEEGKESFQWEQIPTERLTKFLICDCDLVLLTPAVMFYFHQATTDPRCELGILRIQSLPYYCLQGLLGKRLLSHHSIFFRQLCNLACRNLTGWWSTIYRRECMHQTILK